MGQMDNLLPIFKTKIKVAEMKELLTILSLVIVYSPDIEGFSEIDFYNIKSINRTLIQRLNSINKYSKGWERKPHILKMDLNQYNSFVNVYTLNKNILQRANPYYDNLFRQVLIEFDKQKISLQ